MAKYIPAGPPRYSHQKRGLRMLIRNRGVGALLFAPGTGKTAVALDYLTMLALKAGAGSEVRALVISPKSAVDTWVLQSETYVNSEVSIWAEVLGGTIRQRAAALASRGGGNLRETEGRIGIKGTAPRAWHYHRSPAMFIRDAQFPNEHYPANKIHLGPDNLSNSPRLILISTNLDMYSSRARYRSKTMADHILNCVERYKPDVVIIDEMHKIKSASSNVSRLMGRIAEKVPRRIGLTGTVIPHSPLDVFGQWRFIDNRAFGYPDATGKRQKATFTAFKNRYAIMGGYMGYEVKGFRDLDAMQDIMAEKSEVATKEDSLDLPPTTDTIVSVELSPRERQAYAEMKKDLAMQLDSGEIVGAPNRLAQMMRLRQITSGALPEAMGGGELGSSKVDTIVSLCRDTLGDEKRIVIFCLFNREIEALSASLSGKGTEIMTITGATPTKRRLELRQRFGSDDPSRIILVAQIGTISLSVNELVTASHAIFGSLSQRRDDIVQARDRLSRIGQTLPCTFWFCLAPRTVDEVIYRAYLDRSNLENAMLEHIKSM